MNRVNLRISCSHLPSFDFFSKSDPFVVVSQYNDKKRTYETIGNTESIKNDNDPVFVRTVTVEFIPTFDKQLRFEIFDKDCKSSRLDSHDYLGHARLSLQSILTGQSSADIKFREFGKEYSLSDMKGKSKIVVVAEPYSTSDSKISLRFSGRKLAKKDFFSSDPFFVISREINGRKAVIYRSEYLKKNLNPDWKEFEALSLELCGNDLSMTLTLRCFDYDKLSKNDLIGACSFTIGEILGGKTDFELFAKNRRKSQGLIRVASVRQKRLYGFDDYCRAGLQFTTVLAVDMSADNCPRDARQAMHRADGTGEYEHAIRSCANALQQIDSDQMYPVWGFSGVVGGGLSNCFSLTFNPELPKVCGIEQVVGVYRHALAQLKMGQPKSVSGVLETVMTLARGQTDPSKYIVMFVFVCGGRIADLEKTKNLIVSLSEMPTSIIFVGIGQGDFSDLDFLDKGWRNFKSSFGKSCPRDSVTLVRYREYAGSGSGEQVSLKLSADIFKTIQSQALAYFKMKMIDPETLGSRQAQTGLPGQTGFPGQTAQPIPFQPLPFKIQGGTYPAQNPTGYTQQGHPGHMNPAQQQPGAQPHWAANQKTAGAAAASPHAFPGTGYQQNAQFAQTAQQSYGAPPAQLGRTDYARGNIGSVTAQMGALSLGAPRGQGTQPQPGYPGAHVRGEKEQKPPTINPYYSG